MRGKLPRTCNVQKETVRYGSFEGVISLSDLSRLAASVEDDKANINVTFEFYRNEIGLAVIRGKVKSSLNLNCQRCMQVMRVSIDCDFEFLLGADDGDIIASGLDNIEIENGFIDVYDLIEDELILALPLVSRHEYQDCNEYWSNQIDVDDAIEKENPFAVLAKLKGDL